MACARERDGVRDGKHSVFVFGKSDVLEFVRGGGWLLSLRQTHRPTVTRVGCSGGWRRSGNEKEGKRF